MGSDRGTSLDRMVGKSSLMYVFEQRLGYLCEYLEEKKF